MPTTTLWQSSSALTKTITSALVVLSLLIGLPMLGAASSHREAPLITSSPKQDATDVYAFVSPDAPDTVTLIANYLPFQEPAGGPNFYTLDDNVLYEIKIDNDGDAIEDIVYQFDFETETLNGATFLYNTGPITSLNDSDFNVRQTYTLTKLTYYDKADGSASKRAKKEVLGTNLPVPPSNVGSVSIPDYESLQAEAIVELGDTLAFVGQSDDPFFVDLGGTFDLLTIREVPGDEGGGLDNLKGFNVQTLALQIPIEELNVNGEIPTDATDGDSVIGVWTEASRPAVTVLRNGDTDPETGGRLITVSRLGAPLVNEVVIPLQDKDVWNNSAPKDDAQFADYVANPELGVLLDLLYGIAVPPQGPFGSEDQRIDLITIFLTGIDGLTQPNDVVPSEQLRVNLAIAPSLDPSRLGVLGGDVQGYPNGRRLADDVVDISLQAVAGAAYPLFVPEFEPDALAGRLGDGVNENDLPFRESFPYVALPTGGLEVFPHGFGGLLLNLN